MYNEENFDDVFKCIALGLYSKEGVNYLTY